MNQIELIRQTLRHIVSAEMRETALKALSEIESHLTSDFLTRGTITLPTPAKCSRCNNTGSWGGVDGHLYPCKDDQHPPASDRWMPIGTCPKEHGVDYRLWDETDKEERVTWYGRGEWCHEGNYTHWQYLTTPILKQSTAKDTPHDTK